MTAYEAITAGLIAAPLVISLRRKYRRVRLRTRKPASAETAPHVVDYSAARAKAIAWLGDRYLLAKPINRRPR